MRKLANHVTLFWSHDDTGSLDWININPVQGLDKINYSFVFDVIRLRGLEI